MSSSRPPKHNPPHGMEAYDLKRENDLGALSETQQTKLNALKVEIRLENERYLREHPEIQCLISEFLKEVFLRHPANVREFAAEFFTDPRLRGRVDELLVKRQNEREKNALLRDIA